MTLSALGIFSAAGKVAGFPIEYLVVAGGGGTHQDVIVCGGAGGYRSSVSGEMSGGGLSAESPLLATLATNYVVTVGAGGTSAAKGGDSVFGTITSLGGGSGDQAGTWSRINGGSGSGTVFTVTPGTGTAGQGFAGNTGTIASGAPTNGGGGGGASQTGFAATSNTAVGSGGAGVSSSITGSAVVRAGGGGGGYYSNNASTPTGGFGGAGGGGRGMFRILADPAEPGSRDGESGATNSGGGSGAGSPSFGTYTLNGGSGIVILRYSSTLTITIGAGLTGTTSTVGANKVTTITAGTGNVSWAA